MRQEHFFSFFSLSNSITIDPCPANWAVGDDSAAIAAAYLFFFSSFPKPQDVVLELPHLIYSAQNRCLAWAVSRRESGVSLYRRRAVCGRVHGPATTCCARCPSQLYSPWFPCRRGIAWSNPVYRFFHPRLIFCPFSPIFPTRPALIVDQQEEKLYQRKIFMKKKNS